jgi:hypothetical protein
MFYARLKYRIVFSKVYAETIPKAPSINMHKNYVLDAPSYLIYE